QALRTLRPLSAAELGALGGGPAGSNAGSNAGSAAPGDGGTNAAGSGAGSALARNTAALDDAGVAPPTDAAIVMTAAIAAEMPARRRRGDARADAEANRRRQLPATLSPRERARGGRCSACTSRRSLTGCSSRSRIRRTAPDQARLHVRRGRLRRLDVHCGDWQ